MKFIFVNDLHFLSKNPIARTDNLVETQFKKFQFILEDAYQYKASIIIAGDLTDKPRDWYLLPALLRMFSNARSMGIRIYCIYGQHDTYMYSESTRNHTMLGCLINGGFIYRLGPEPAMFYKDVDVYGCHYGQEVPSPLHRYKYNVLVIHAPISDRPLFPGHEYTDAENFLDQYPAYNLIHCGDIHRRFFKWSSKKKLRAIFNCGPMIRKTAEEHNFKHVPSYMYFDTITKHLEFVEIDHEPANKVLTRDHIEEPKEIKRMMTDFVNAMRQDVEYKGTNILENIDKYIKENKVPQDVVKILFSVMEGDLGY